MDTISLIQKRIKEKIDRLKNHAAYSVDTMEELKYVRGQIKSLEDLLQEIKDLLKE
jgi:predicted RNase H-like HicB family nuclease